METAVACLWCAQARRTIKKAAHLIEPPLKNFLKEHILFYALNIFSCAGIYFYFISLVHK